MDPHESMHVILEEFMAVLVGTAFERHVLGVGEVDAVAIVRREVVHQLVLQPAPFSAIAKSLSLSVTEHPAFDDILHAVASKRFVGLWGDVLFGC
jgi:hypothetical protein